MQGGVFTEAVTRGHVRFHTGASEDLADGDRHPEQRRMVVIRTKQKLLPLAALLLVQFVPTEDRIEHGLPDDGADDPIDLPEYLSGEREALRQIAGHVHVLRPLPRKQERHLLSRR